MKKFFSLVGGFAFAVLCLYCFGAMLKTLAPTITFVVIAVLTILNFWSPINTALSMAGIVTYWAAWPMLWVFGKTTSMIVFYIAVILWIWSFYRTVTKRWIPSVSDIIQAKPKPDVAENC